MSIVMVGVVVVFVAKHMGMAPKELVSCLCSGYDTLRTLLQTYPCWLCTTDLLRDLGQHARSTERSTLSHMWVLNFESLL